MLDTEMLIGAKFVAGTEAAEAVINPKTEETIVTLPDASVAQVDAAVNAATTAFKTWSRTTPAERSGAVVEARRRHREGGRGLRHVGGAELRQTAHPSSARRDAWRGRIASDSSPAQRATCMAWSLVSIWPGSPR